MQILKMAQIVMASSPQILVCFHIKDTHGKFIIDVSVLRSWAL